MNLGIIILVGLTSGEMEIDKRYLGVTQDQLFPKELGIQWATYKAVSPYSDYLYKNVIDKIPKIIRRPIEKNFGLVLDYAQTIPGYFLKFENDYTNKEYSFYKISSYGQMWNACIETGIAGILKNYGNPISLGGIDTQHFAFSSLPSIMEFRRRGYMAINGVGSIDTMKKFLSNGNLILLSTFGSNGRHTIFVNGFDSTGIYVSNLYGHPYYMGKNTKVKYSGFNSMWATSQFGKNFENYMVVVPNLQHQSISEFTKNTSLRRKDSEYSGFYLYDFMINKEAVFLELAYTYNNQKADITFRPQYLFLNLSKIYAQFKGKHSYIGGVLYGNYKFSEEFSAGVYLERLAFTPLYWSSKVPFETYVSSRIKNFEISIGYDGKGAQGRLRIDVFDKIKISMLASMINNLSIFGTVEYVNF